MNQIVGEENASSVSLNLARASCVAKVMNKTSVVIDALNSPTRCVYSL